MPTEALIYRLVYFYIIYTSIVLNILRMYALRYLLLCLSTKFSFWTCRHRSGTGLSNTWMQATLGTPITYLGPTNYCHFRSLFQYIFFAKVSLHRNTIAPTVSAVLPCWTTCENFSIKHISQ